MRTLESLYRNTITRNTILISICYYRLEWSINIRKDIPKSGSRGVKEQQILEIGNRDDIDTCLKHYIIYGLQLFIQPIRDDDESVMNLASMN